MSSVPQGLVHLAWLLPLVLLLLYLSSPRARGDITQRRIRRLLKQGLDSRQYTILNDLRIPAGGGSILLEHVVLSKFGIFVINGIHAPGNVTGGEFQDRWKRHRLGRIHRFDNPVHQNRLAIDAMQSLLGLPSSRFTGLTALIGHGAYSGERPQSVVNVEDLVARIRRQTDLRLESDRVQESLRKLQESRLPDESRSGMFRGVAQVVLTLLILAGAWWAFGDDLRNMVGQQQAFQAQQELVPSEAEWEEQLVCAESTDTGRCACYERGGEKVDIALPRCRELARRGSILEN